MRGIEWDMLALMEVIQIRRATLQDAEAICLVHKASITELCSSHYTPEQIEGWAGPKKPDDYQQSIKDGIMLVAERENEVVGLAGMMDPAKGIIEALYLHPDHIGQGIGTRLLDALEGESKSAGAPKVTLKATLNSVSFYQARGFSSLGEGVHSLPSGIQVPCVHMEKHLES